MYTLDLHDGTPKPMHLKRTCCCVPHKFMHADLLFAVSLLLQVQALQTCAVFIYRGRGETLLNLRFEST